MSEAADSPNTKRSPMQPGQRFGRLTTVAYSHTAYDGVAWWRLRCACGRECVRGMRMVLRGNTQSCGCLRREMAAARNRSRALHGKWRTSEFTIWSKMIKRCANPRDKNFPGYGGRGITVCERWRLSFQAFLDDMGRRPSKAHSLDRVDVNGNYCPENCRWATSKEQGRNKRNNHIVIYQGREITMAEACELSGFDRQVVKMRLTRGWSMERTFSEPMPPKRVSPRNFPEMASGLRFGRLVSLAFVGIDDEKRPRWRFRCDCGKEVVTLTRLVWAEHTTSCGCRASERFTALNIARTTHGKSLTTEYEIWRKMIARCHNEDNRDYHRYGAIGIKVCERWRESFQNFLDDLGERPSLNHGINRFPDRSGPYAPGNCRWATPRERQRNTSTNRLVIYRGDEMTAIEASELSGTDYRVVKKRLQAGWTDEDIFGKPIRGYVRSWPLPVVG